MHKIIALDFFPDRHRKFLKNISKYFTVYTTGIVADLQENIQNLELITPTFTQEQVTNSKNIFLETYQKNSIPISAEVVQQHLNLWALSEQWKQTIAAIAEREDIVAILVMEDSICQYRSAVLQAKKLRIPTYFIEHAHLASQFIPSFRSEALLTSRPITDFYCCSNKGDLPFL